MGGRLFASNCSVCHGSDAKGAYGFPNLTDADWRWGGTPALVIARGFWRSFSLASNCSLKTP